MAAKKLRCPSRLGGSTKYIVERIVGNQHVGDTMAEVQAAVLKRFPKKTVQQCPEIVALALDYAAEVHTANRKLYIQVMRGSFGAVKSKKYRTPRGCTKSTSVQTLIFAKSHFTRTAALVWARSHKFKASKADCKANTCRVRQVALLKFCKGTFRTIPLRSGVKAVIGKKKVK